MVAKGKWKGVPGVYVAARKSQLGGLWPYLDDHDVKDRTAEVHDASNAPPELGGGDGESEDGEEWDLDGWDEVGDGEWEPVVDVGEGGGRDSGVRRRGGGRRRASTAPAPPTRRERRSKEEREVEAMFEQNFR